MRVKSEGGSDGVGAAARVDGVGVDVIAVIQGVSGEVVDPEGDTKTMEAGNSSAAALVAGVGTFAAELLMPAVPARHRQGSGVRRVMLGVGSRPLLQVYMVLGSGTASGAESGAEPATLTWKGCVWAQACAFRVTASTRVVIEVLSAECAPLAVSSGPAGREATPPSSLASIVVITTWSHAPK
jgi:hypothetical protein